MDWEFIHLFEIINGHPEKDFKEVSCKNQKKVTEKQAPAQDVAQKILPSK
jgi:hypothetical protein